MPHPVRVAAVGALLLLPATAWSAPLIHAEYRASVEAVVGCSVPGPNEFVVSVTWDAGQAATDVFDYGGGTWSWWYDGSTAFDLSANTGTALDDVGEADLSVLDDAYGLDEYVVRGFGSNGALIQVRLTSTDTSVFQQEEALPVALDLADYDFEYTFHLDDAAGCTMDGFITSVTTTYGDTDGDGATDDVDVCQGSDDGVDTDGDGTPNGCEPPNLSLSGVPTPGGAIVLVAEAGPGEVVHFGGTPGLGGVGPCSQAYGVCSSLGPNARYLGSAVADAQGLARLRITVPAAAPVGLAVTAQCAVVRGSTAALSGLYTTTLQ